MEQLRSDKLSSVGITNQPHTLTARLQYWVNSAPHDKLPNYKKAANAVEKFDKAARSGGHVYELSIDCDGLLSLPPIPIGVDTLTLNGNSKALGMGVIKGFATLPDCVCALFFENFDLSDVLGNIFNYIECKHITVLNFVDCQFSEMPKVPPLAELYITRCNGIQDLSGEALQNVIDLHLSGLAELTTLSETFSDLKTLTLEDCPKVSCLSGKCFPELAYCVLWNLPEFESFTGEFPDLNDLRCKDLPQLKHFASFPHLRHLDLSGNFASLEDWSILCDQDGNLRLGSNMVLYEQIKYDSPNKAALLFTAETHAGAKIGMYKNPDKIATECLIALGEDTVTAEFKLGQVYCEGRVCDIDLDKANKLFQAALADMIVPAAQEILAKKAQQHLSTAKSLLSATLP